MKLGIDFDGTLASYPNAFIHLMRAATEVHVITLNPIICIHRIKYQLGIEDMDIDIHVYPHERLGFDERFAPQWKAEMCTKLGIDVFFDDRADICQHVEEHTDTHVMHVTERLNRICG